MMLNKLLAKNSNASPELVIPITVFSLFVGVIFTGTAIILAVQGGQETALAVISTVAVLAWASLGLIMHKYSRVTW